MQCRKVVTCVSLISMSGDSPDNLPHKPREEEASLLMPDRAKAPPVASVVAVTAGAATAAAESQPGTDAEDQKQEFIQRDKNENKVSRPCCLRASLGSTLKNVM